MAHALSIGPVGLAEMFYVGESPWHGLGTRLKQVATSEETITAAHLDWTVSLRRLYTADTDEVPRCRATVRDDTEAVLGIVGTRYTPIQNREAFAFMDALVGEAAAMYHTAGALDGGRRVWILAKLPHDLVVVPRDALEKYLLLFNAHDGTSSLVCRFTMIRVVCQNTLTAALNERADTLKIRHTRGATERVAEARRVLGIGLRYFDVLGWRCRVLAQKQLTKKMLEGYFSAIFPLELDAGGSDFDYTKRVHETLAHLFEEGRGNQLPHVKGTLWAAYNAVTEYVDHVRGVSARGMRRRGSAEAALFGAGAEIKRRAFSVAMKMARVAPHPTLLATVNAEVTATALP